MKQIKSILAATVLGLSSLVAAPMAHANESFEPSDPVFLCVETFPSGYLVIVLVDGVPVREFFSDECPVL